MKKALKIIFWIVAFLLFPITAGLYFILSRIICKSKLSKGWRRFCWAIYGIAATCMVTYKALVFIVFHTMNTADTTPTINRENICPAPYRTSDDFYKLTGVKFPELEIVDSLYYDDMCLNPNTYHEYKFVVKEGNKHFYMRLMCACRADSTHWRYNEDEDIYSYWIYPDQHPVDRSRGMCDRMVKREDGSLTEDWDGDFISVTVQRDTIILRKGWMR